MASILSPYWQVLLLVNISSTEMKDPFISFFITFNNLVIE